MHYYGITFNTAIKNTLIGIISFHTLDFWYRLIVPLITYLLICIFRKKKNPLLRIGLPITIFVMSPSLIVIMSPFGGFNHFWEIHARLIIHNIIVFILFYVIFYMMQAKLVIKNNEDKENNKLEL